METCDVLVVGGGPAGSSCAWQLRKQGYDVVVMDKSQFPRDKICTGWIVPQIIESLELDVSEYSATCVWQPITGFQVGLWSRPGTTIRFDRPVSYGIRRCEFDNYLLRRSGARLMLGEPVHELRRTDDGWVINDSLKTRLLIGAGGDRCPVARWLRGDQRPASPLIAALEVEYPIAAEASGSVDAETPQLYFCDDLAGYGWCVLKQGYLNLGIGRVTGRDVPAYWDQLLGRLRASQVLTADPPLAARGHAYHLYDGTQAHLVENRLLLIGDAAGLADRHSGEGIRPAVESGLLAAAAVHAANGQYDRNQLSTYEVQLRKRFGKLRVKPESDPLSFLSNPWRIWLLDQLFSSRLFLKHLVLDRWFLHRNLAALRVTASAN